MATSIELMKTRLDYRGGNREGRIIKDKLTSLRAAIKSSYQSETIELADGRHFRALINPNKLKNEYDNKVISIPFEDVCVNKERKGKTTKSFEPIGLKGGDTFRWIETDTYWITYLQYVEELAYFRGEIRKCNDVVEIGENTYHIYIRGPAETSVVLNIKSQENLSDLNYSKVMYITKNEETLAYLHRFAKVELQGKPWEVHGVNADDADGIIEVVLKETYSNTIEKNYSKTEEEKNETIIQGDNVVKPFSIVKYSIEEDLGGRWYVDSKKAKILNQDSTQAEIEIVTGKSGDFNLVYEQEDSDDIVLHIKISSLF
jgi:hypothetical protein